MIEQNNNSLSAWRKRHGYPEELTRSECICDRCQTMFLQNMFYWEKFQKIFRNCKTRCIYEVDPDTGPPEQKFNSQQKKPKYCLKHYNVFWVEKCPMCVLEKVRNGQI